MKKLLLLFICFVISFPIFSQINDLIPVNENYPYSKWTKEIVKEANTAENIEYLDKEEKMVIFYCNLVRKNGNLFASTFLENYVDSKQLKKNDYVTSLYKDLNSVKDLPLLESQKDLYEIAKEHAINSGKTGHVGHKGFDKRFKNVLGKKYYTIAENCDYGNDKALDIVMSLLIDEGIPSLGHRKNILEEKMNSIGVSIRIHKTYRFNCVMDFGGR